MDGPAPSYQDPAQLLSTKKVWREEFVQRLLTTLIVGGHYPPWNTRSRPTDRGVTFLRALDELSFGSPGTDATVFVDELELAAPVPTQKGGAAPTGRSYGRTGSGSSS